MNLLKKWTGKYSILLFSLLLSFGLHANESSKVIVKEISVNQETTIKTSGPRIPLIHVNGTISSNTERGYYTLKGRSEELILRINKTYNIHTWEENKVKQVVNITVRAASTEIEQKIIAALEEDLKTSPDNSLDLSGFMGLNQISIKNSWLKKSNDNTITLNKGQSYKFEYLELSSELYIPKKSNLEIDTEYTDIRLGNFEGKLELKLKDGALSSPFINKLNSQISTSKINVTEIRDATISANRSTIEIDKTASLSIGKIEQTVGCMNNVFIENRGSFNSINFSGREKAKNSSLNKYYLKTLDDLDVYSSLNDKIQIESIGIIRLRDVSFSDFEISTLEKSIEGIIKYGEINIFEIKNDDFKKIELESAYSSLRISGGNIENVEVEIQQTQKEDQAFLDGLSDNEMNMNVSSDYKLISETDNKEFIYSKGTGKKKIYLVCNRCDLILK